MICLGLMVSSVFMILFTYRACLCFHALTRVFLLIPTGLYMFFGWPPEGVYFIFVTGAIDSYIEDVLVVIVSLVVGAPLLLVLRKIPGLKYPLS